MPPRQTQNRPVFAMTNIKNITSQSLDISGAALSLNLTLLSSPPLTMHSLFRVQPERIYNPITAMGFSAFFSLSAGQD